MVKFQSFNNIEEFYEEYREIKISKKISNELEHSNSIHNIIVNRFENKLNQSLKQNCEFSKHVKKNKLNILDLEIEALANLSQASGIDDKEIFENISLFNFREYDFESFQNYFVNSNLVINKIVNYSLDEDNNNNNLNNKKLIKKKREDLFKLKVIFKRNNYFSIKEVRHDLSYLSFLNNSVYELKSNDKKAQHNLSKKIKEIILENISKSSKNFSFISKLNLNDTQAILLFDLYFKNQFEIRSGSRFINSSNLTIKELFPEKYFKSLEKKLLNENLIKKENRWGDEEIILTKKLISLIENKEYTNDDLEKDNKILFEDKFLKPIISNIKFEDVFIDEAKKDIVRRTLSQIKNYDLIFNQWKIKDSISYGKGLIMNFYGSPGTGKTMLAKSIGNYLDKKIIEVDFSQLQNMYVGETEKNISKAFSIAKKEDAILFFDEADSLIQNRKLSKNSWEKSQTNVLLKEIENFEGVCVFATNLIENYDPAIERRIALNLEFDLPDSKLRSKIIENHFPSKDALADDVDFDKISKEFELTGGEIKNAIMHTVRIAASDKNNKEKKIKMKHLEFGFELVEVSKFDSKKNSDKVNGNMFM